MPNDAFAEPNSQRTVCLPEVLTLRGRIHRIVKEVPFTSTFFSILDADAGNTLTSEEIAIVLRTALSGFALHARAEEARLVQTLQFNIKRIAAAIIDDERMLAETIRHLDQIEDNEKVPSGYRPRPPRMFLPGEDKAALVARVKLLMRAYDEAAGRPEEGQTSRRVNVYPFYNQTDNGIFLAFNGKSPCQLWLPWGLCSLVRRSGDTAGTAAFLARLELKRMLPNRANISDLRGPVFGVLALDGNRLPEPVQLTDHRQFTPSHIARIEWERLFYGTA